MRRYHGIEILGPDGNEELPLGRFYLVRVSHTTKGWERYELRTEPARTNMSRQVCTDGWCGTTNDVAVYAYGAVAVGSDARGRVRIRPIPVSELEAEEETSDA